MTTQKHSDRNWRRDVYSREEKLDIIRRQHYRSYSGGKTAKDAQRILIDQAAVLTLLIFDMEQEYTKTGKMNKSYLSNVNTYNRILFKLGAKAKKKSTSAMNPADLESIINDNG